MTIQGSRSRAPIAAPRDARPPSAATCTCSRSTGLSMRVTASKTSTLKVLYSLVPSSSSSDSSDKLLSLSMYPRSTAVLRVDAVHGQPFARAHCSTSRCPPYNAAEVVNSFHGQPFARAHCSISKCPHFAAFAHVRSSHGQPFARNHCRTSRCPFFAADEHVSAFHGQPFARNHCRTSRCPPSAADEHVNSFHGQPFARAHCSISKCPHFAAFAHVQSSHGQPFARNHCNTSRWPPFAAPVQKNSSFHMPQPLARNHCTTSRCPPSAASEHAFSSHRQLLARAHFITSRCQPCAALEHVFASHGQPFSRNDFNSSRFPVLAATAQRFCRRDRRPLRCRRCTALTHPRYTASCSASSYNCSPVAATASRIARLTAGSRARSAGSSKYSDLRMCVATRWLGRRGMASPAVASRSRVGFCARASRQNVASKDIAEGVVRAALWSRLPRKEYVCNRLNYSKLPLEMFLRSFEPALRGERARVLFSRFPSRFTARH